MSFEKHHPRVSSPCESVFPIRDNISNSRTSQQPIKDVEFRIVRHFDVLEVQPPPPIIRHDIERNAWAEATRFFRPTSVLLYPPPHVDINKL